MHVVKFIAGFIAGLIIGFFGTFLAYNGLLLVLRDVVLGNFLLLGGGIASAVVVYIAVILIPQPWKRSLRLGAATPIGLLLAAEVISMVIFQIN